jgi:hypothetical protein
LVLHEAAIFRDGLGRKRRQLAGDELGQLLARVGLPDIEAALDRLGELLAELPIQVNFLKSYLVSAALVTGASAKPERPGIPSVSPSGLATP